MVAKYDEVELRNFKMAYLLVTGLGPRPSAIAKTKIGEFLNVKKLEDNVLIMKVTDYKTFNSLGPCPIASMVEGLYEATNMYLECFRTDECKKYDVAEWHEQLHFTTKNKPPPGL